MRLCSESATIGDSSALKQELRDARQGLTADKLIAADLREAKCLT
jgi:hypothetical protein